MNNLNDGKERAGDSAVETDQKDETQFPDPSDITPGDRSAFGTDPKSVNIKKGMVHSSNLNDGENQNKTSEPDIKINEISSSGEAGKNGTDPENDNSPDTDAGSSEEKVDSPGTDHKRGNEGENMTDPSSRQEQVSDAEEHPDHENEEEEEDEEIKDYGNYSRQELINELQSLLNANDLVKIEKQVREIKSCFEELSEDDRKAASLKAKEEKGDTAEKKNKKDALDNRFEALMNRFKTRKSNLSADLEKQKELNLQKKYEILEILRKFVDAEETNTSIGALKRLQEEWKSVGPIPRQFNRSLWASYNALIDRFYDNRSIYFELKELDRKKNLEGKIELCEKAEKLARGTNLKEAIRELNELHEEFKHIGPVPMDQQEEIWQRFKAASDQIYSRRKEFLHDLKKNLQENLEKKKKLVEEVAPFADFDSDSIIEWNNKTKEILDIQKQWESIGGMPREHTKTVNKSFWSSFKAFFSSKNKFFKKLEGKREENLQRKEELVKKALELKDSENWEETASRLKDIQQEWKDIGPVPEKLKNDVFMRFKKACDEFFDRRRQHGKELESEYVENLRKKEEICAELEDMIGKKNFDVDRFRERQASFEQIGFVPRNAIKKIQKRFQGITRQFLDQADIPEEQKSEIKFSAEINKIRSAPDSNRRLHRKESEIRKLIGKLESDIAIWKNNLDFFKDSDTADKLRAEFNGKIDQATAQLNELKDELKMLIKM